MSVAQPELWDVDAPALHTLRWTLLENGETLTRAKPPSAFAKLKSTPKTASGSTASP